MDTTNQSEPSRRIFIRKLSAWAAASAGILASLSLLRQFLPRQGGSRKRYRIGRKNNFPINTFTYLSEHQIFVYRDHQGIRAVSAVCTHLGCIIEKNAGGFQCPCHGSCYNGEGRVLSGAATKDLPWYSLHKDPDGRIVVDQGRLAGPGEKLYL